jgi:hypothetical protein
MNMNWNDLTRLLVVGLAGALLGIGVWIYFSDDTAPAGDGAAATPAERKVLYWHDPMVPGQKFDKPGKSPFMDMDLVPVYDEQGRSSVAGGRTPGATADDAPADDTGVVTVRPEVVNNLGVRTAPASRSTAPPRVETHGYAFRDARGVGVRVDIFERDAGWVRRGLAAEVRFADVIGRTYTGSVTQVSADIGIGARSFTAAVRITKPDAAIKANAQAAVTILGPRPAQGRLLIPREALIRTGTRTAVVLALGDGRFKPVEVVAGPEIGEHIEIVKGIKEGDRVVTSGQFLLDSEASVRASFSRMQSDGAPPATAPSEHAGH